MTLDSKALKALARAYDREDAAQRGEPDPWMPNDDGPWRDERLACAEVAARAFLSALPAGEVGELVERLRDDYQADWIESPSNSLMRWLGRNVAVRDEAATALASLSARIAALENAVAKAESHIVNIYGAMNPHATYEGGNRMADNDEVVQELRALSRLATTGGGDV